jgi:hypothetical protein
LSDFRFGFSDRGTRDGAEISLISSNAVDRRDAADNNSLDRRSSLRFAALYTRL